jgi:hypothetical protein
MRQTAPPSATEVVRTISFDEFSLRQCRVSSLLARKADSWWIVSGIRYRAAVADYNGKKYMAVSEAEDLPPLEI